MTVALLLLLAAKTQTQTQTPLFTGDPAALVEVDAEMTGVAVGDANDVAAWEGYYNALGDRYPDDLLRRELKRVVFVGDLTYRGQKVGGLADTRRRTIALCVARDGVSMNGETLTDDFHHEVAHVLFDRHAKRFPQKAWLRANAKEFRYRHVYGFQAITGNDFGREKSPTLNEQGLLHAYAASCYDEDLAATAAELLTPLEEPKEKALLTLASRYPRLATKFDLMATFYRAIFPGIWLPELPKPADAPKG